MPCHGGSAPEILWARQTNPHGGKFLMEDVILILPAEAVTLLAMFVTASAAQRSCARTWGAGVRTHVPVARNRVL